MKKLISIILTISLIFYLVSCANTARPDWQEHLDLGRKYLLDGDYEQAIIEFNKVIEIEPKNVDAYLGLAEAYVAAGDYDSAISVLERGYDDTENQVLQDRINELRGLAAEQVTTTAVETTMPETTAEAVPEDNVAKDFEWTFEDGLLTVSGHGDMPAYIRYSEWSNIAESVKSIVINNGITNISDYAFSDFVNLESVTIPNSVFSIGNDSFSSCGKLTSFLIPSSVTNIGGNPWILCYSLTEFILEQNNNFCIIDGVLFTSDMSRLITYPEAKEEPYYEIPFGVKTIGEHAFAWNNHLTEIVIPDSVTTICAGAFLSCEHIDYMSIPKSVTKIECNPWLRCGRLCENAKIEIVKNDYYCIKDDVVFTTDMKKIVSYLSINHDTSYTIPDGVEEIGEDAFPGFCELESLTIPNSVKAIDGYAFCGEMETLVIPNGVESIGEEAFSNCYQLSSVHIPKSVKYIGNHYFWLSGNPPTFYAPSGSYAEQYAKENGIPFVAE